MLFQRVDGKGPRRVGRGRYHMILATYLDDIRRMATARPLGVKGVDGAPLHGGDGVFDKAAFIERIGMDHHLHVHGIGHRKATVDCTRRRAPILVQLERAGPGSDLFFQGGGQRGVALAAKARFIGKASAACSIRPICHGPGVQVVARVPCAGPVPPPSIVVRPECRASSICCGQMKWIWLSNPPAVRMRPSPAMTSVPGPTVMVTPGCVSGLPALPMAAMRPSVRPTSALMIPV